MSNQNILKRFRDDQKKTEEKRHLQIACVRTLFLAGKGLEPLPNKMQETAMKYFVDDLESVRSVTLLEQAIICNNLSIVKLLMRADVPVMDGLKIAAQFGQTEMIKMMLSIDKQKGPDENLLGYLQKREALDYAASNGNISTVEILLNDGVRFDFALWSASFYGHEQTVQLLIDAGMYYPHSLCAAASQGHKSIVEKLISVGQHHEKSLVKAAKNGHTSIVKMLLNAGIDKKLATAKFYAKKRNHKEVIDLLSKHYNANHT